MALSSATPPKSKSAIPSRSSSTAAASPPKSSERTTSDARPFDLSGVLVVAVKARFRRGLRTWLHVGRGVFWSQPSRPKCVRELVKISLPLRVLAQNPNQHLQCVAAAAQRVEAQHVALDERRALVPHSQVAVLLYSRHIRRAIRLLPVLESKLEIVGRRQIVGTIGTREKFDHR